MKERGTDEEGIFPILSFFVFKDFIYLFVREREREHKQAEWQAEAEREAGSLLSRDQCGAQSQDPVIMTWAEGRGFNSLSHPGTPDYIHL